MIIACAVALASWTNAWPAPKPQASGWRQRAFMTGDSSLDEFAVRIVDKVGNADWKGFVEASDRNVDFVAYRYCMAESDPSPQMLFDDIPAESETLVKNLNTKWIVVDTREEPTPFTRGQFAYFASLVESSTSDILNVPKWGHNVSGRYVESLAGPAIWARYAPNAMWRIGLERTNGFWAVKSLILEGTD